MPNVPKKLSNLVYLVSLAPSFFNHFTFNLLFLTINALRLTVFVPHSLSDISIFMGKSFIIYLIKIILDTFDFSLYLSLIK